MTKKCRYCGEDDFVLVEETTTFWGFRCVGCGRYQSVTKTEFNTWLVSIEGIDVLGYKMLGTLDVIIDESK